MSLTVPVPAETSAIAHVEPSQRGVLRIETHAAKHVVEGVLAHAVPNVAASEARVTSIADDGIELDVAITLEYPTVPLSGILAELRRNVAEEVGRQLGRPVRHLDLTVSKFVVSDTSSRHPSRRVI
jgi:uncharacterized alkaline shock family protein YloU